MNDNKELFLASRYPLRRRLLEEDTFSLPFLKECSCDAADVKDEDEKDATVLGTEVVEKLLGSNGLQLLHLLLTSQWSILV